MPSSRADREALTSARTLVVKVGTRVLTGSDGRLDRAWINDFAAQLCRAADGGRDVVLVSSGAVGAGIGKLGLPKRPTDLARLQAVAAIGQADLIQAYEQAFTKLGRHAAQILLTAGDLKRRSGFLNVRNALLQLFELRAIPIINENDSVAVAELMTTFGDNDRLAAAVASLLPTAALIVLSDVAGLYDRPPEEAGASVVPTIQVIDAEVRGLVRDRASGLSRGGMASKLRAARLATTHGHSVVIACGRQANVLDQLLAGEPIGTLFLPAMHAIRGRRRWIGSTAEIAGRILVDAGAARAVVTRGSSLLPIGITDVVGPFAKGDAVALVDPDGRTIAQGLTNYSASEIQRILGQPSDRIAAILGYCPYAEVVHRDNMVLNDAS
jgi:glutamate 5-kinase